MEQQEAREELDLLVHLDYKEIQASRVIRDKVGLQEILVNPDWLVTVDPQALQGLRVNLEHLVL